MKPKEVVLASIIKSLKSIADRVFTITGDNGSGFAYHEKCNPYMENQIKSQLVDLEL